MNRKILNVISKKQNIIYNAYNDIMKSPSDFILKLSKIKVTRELVDLLFGKGTKIKQVKVSINGTSVCIEIPHYEYYITESTIRYYSCSTPEHITNAFAIVRYIDNLVNKPHRYE